MAVNHDTTAKGAAAAGRFARRRPSLAPPVQPLGLGALARDLFRRFRNEHAAFLFACAYLVIEYNRLQMVWPVLDVIPWAQTLLLLSLFFALRDPLSRRPPLGAVVPMTAFALSVLLSTAFAYLPSKALSEWTMFFGWYVVVLLLAGVITTRQRLLLFLVVYYLVNLKMAQHGFRVWAGRGFGFAGWGATGSPGWFQNSGEFGMQMAVFLPIVIAHIATLRHRVSKSVRLLLYGIGLVVVSSIIASNSRGAVAALAAVGLWTLTYARHRARWSLWQLQPRWCLVVMPQEFKARFETAGADDTSTYRLTYWKYAIDAVAERPMFGVGFRNWPEYVVSNYPELIGLESGKGVEAIHNTYLEATTELGLVGAIVYVFILLQIFVMNRATARRTARSSDYLVSATAQGLNGSLFAMLVASTFMSVLYYPFVWVLLALTVCTAGVAVSRQPLHAGTRSAGVQPFVGVRRREQRRLQPNRSARGSHGGTRPRSVCAETLP